MSENPEPFLVPRIDGSERFEDHFLPFDLFTDLLEVENIIRELALWRYKVDHPAKKNAPRGFYSDYEFKLKQTAEGSVKPMIFLVMASLGMQKPLYPVHDYLTKGKECLIETLNQVRRGEDLPTGFPRSVFPMFEKLASKLRDGEYIEFDPEHPTEKAIYDIDIKNKIQELSIKEETFEELITLVGAVSNAGHLTNKFELNLKGKIGVTGSITPENKDKIIDSFTNWPHKKIKLKAVCTVTRGGKVLSIGKIESMETLSNRDIESRVFDFKKLRDGWFNGRGVALSHEKLDEFASFFTKYFDSDLALPYTYPMPSGGLQLEWPMEKSELQMEVDLRSMSAQLYIVKSNEDEATEYNIDLATAEAWSIVNSIIRNRGINE